MSKTTVSSHPESGMRNPASSLPARQRGRGRPPKALALIPARPLDERAAVVKQYHEAVRMVSLQAAGWAAMAGLELVAARDEVGNGSFEKWVEDNCGFTRMTAYKYMALAQELKTSLTSAEDAKQFMWLLERPPSELDPKQRTRLNNLIGTAAAGRTLQQLYLDFGIVKDKPALPPAEPKRQWTEAEMRNDMARRKEEHVKQYTQDLERDLNRIPIWEGVEPAFLKDLLNVLERATHALRQAVKRS